MSPKLLPHPLPGADARRLWAQVWGQPLPAPCGPAGVGGGREAAAAGREQVAFSGVLYSRPLIRPPLYLSLSSAGGLSSELAKHEGSSGVWSPGRANLHLILESEDEAKALSPGGASPPADRRRPGFGSLQTAADASRAPFA